jgi:uncharacterized repeat protein (TIGR03803 family)
MRSLRTRSTFLAAALLLSGVLSYSQTVTALYNFAGQNSSEYPQAVMLAQGRDAELYGTTTGGGVNGSIFKVSTSRAFTQLFTFDTTDGCCPGSGMTLASDGNFYGSAGFGGSGNNGVLFEMAPDGSMTTIHSFAGGSDGANPFAPPIEASDGNLYGTTTGSTVYKYTPSSGTFSTIYQFTFGNSLAPLLQTANGVLYGTTAGGGWAHCGTIFEISTTGVLLSSYPFPCHAGGANPGGGALLQASDGSFYGTTEAGGAKNQGTIFKMTPDFKVSILYSFLGHTKNTLDGASPAAGLIQATDGNLYGTTSAGGSSGVGTLFSISTDGTYQMLYSFGGSTGTRPSGTLMQHTNGMLYGTASAGGVSKLGTVYELNLGLPPFIAFVQHTGAAGQRAEILGQQLTGATSVTFNGVSATFTAISPTYLAATVPAGATSGPVVVTTPTATLTSNVNFNIVP